MWVNAQTDALPGDSITVSAAELKHLPIDLQVRTETIQTQAAGAGS